MRIRTDGKFRYRQDEIDAVSDLFDCSKTEAMIRAARHTKIDARNKQRALSYAHEHLPPKHTAELADRLSTPYLRLTVEQSSEVVIRDGSIKTAATDEQ